MPLIGYVCAFGNGRFRGQCHLACGCLVGRHGIAGGEVEGSIAGYLCHATGVVDEGAVVRYGDDCDGSSFIGIQCKSACVGDGAQGIACAGQGDNGGCANGYFRCLRFHILKGGIALGGDFGGFGRAVACQSAAVGNCIVSVSLCLSLCLSCFYIRCPFFPVIADTISDVACCVCRYKDAGQVVAKGEDALSDSRSRLPFEGDGCQSAALTEGRFPDGFYRFRDHNGGESTQSEGRIPDGFYRFRDHNGSESTRKEGHCLDGFYRFPDLNGGESTQIEGAFPDGFYRAWDYKGGESTGFEAIGADCFHPAGDRIAAGRLWGKDNQCFAVGSQQGFVGVRFKGAAAFGYCKCADARPCKGSISDRSNRSRYFDRGQTLGVLKGTRSDTGYPGCCNSYLG